MQLSCSVLPALALPRRLDTPLLTTDWSGHKEWLLHFGWAGPGRGEAPTPPAHAVLGRIRISGVDATDLRGLRVRRDGADVLRLDSVDGRHGGEVSAGQMLEAMALQDHWAGGHAVSAMELVLGLAELGLALTWGSFSLELRARAAQAHDLARVQAWAVQAA